MLYVKPMTMMVTILILFTMLMVTIMTTIITMNDDSFGSTVDANYNHNHSNNLIWLSKDSTQERIEGYSEIVYMQHVKVIKIHVIVWLGIRGLNIWPFRPLEHLAHFEHACRIIHCVNT